MRSYHFRWLPGSVRPKVHKHASHSKYLTLSHLRTRIYFLSTLFIGACAIADLWSVPCLLHINLGATIVGPDNLQYKAMIIMEGEAKEVWDADDMNQLPTPIDSIESARPLRLVSQSHSVIGRQIAQRNVPG